jgi:peptidoglycan/xylan/chitin deacetylase (PgdA/CDA1 family)
MVRGREALKSTCARLMITLGIARLTRAVLWRDRVAILLYHDPDPVTLDRHLSYLKRICDLVPLKELAHPGNRRPRAVVTFDDGHARNASLLPVFIKHNVRPTIFLCSGVVGQQRTHWWLHPAAQQAGVERLKGQRNSERLSELQTHGFCQHGDGEASGLSAEQIEAMRPFVDFQSHTRFHPVLTSCDDAECEDEIALSKQEIESLIRNPCEHFAYPNGSYSAREVDLVKQAGYKTARTCDVGWNDNRSDPFRLRAIEVDDDSTVHWFAVQLTCIPSYIRQLRSGGNWTGHRRQH